MAWRAAQHLDDDCCIQFCGEIVPLWHDFHLSPGSSSASWYRGSAEEIAPFRLLGTLCTPCKQLGLLVVDTCG